MREHVGNEVSLYPYRRLRSIMVELYSGLQGR